MAELVTVDLMLTAVTRVLLGLQRVRVSPAHFIPKSQGKGSQCPKESKMPLNCEEIRRDWSLPSQAASAPKAGLWEFPLPVPWSQSDCRETWIPDLPPAPGKRVLSSQHSTASTHRVLNPVLTARCTHSQGVLTLRCTHCQGVLTRGVYSLMGFTHSQVLLPGCTH